jgi:hypothetical protein
LFKEVPVFPAVLLTFLRRLLFLTKEVKLYINKILTATFKKTESQGLFDTELLNLVAHDQYSPTH